MIGKLLKRLLEKEKDFNIKNHPGCFNWAVQHGNYDFIEYLIEKGANVNALGNDNHEEAPDWILNGFSQVDFPFKFRSSSPVFELPLIIALNKNKNDFDYLTRLLETFDMAF